jgi:hypothetical protein
LPACDLVVLKGREAWWPDDDVWLWRGWYSMDRSKLA